MDCGKLKLQPRQQKLCKKVYLKQSQSSTGPDAVGEATLSLLVQMTRNGKKICGAAVRHETTGGAGRSSPREGRQTAL